MRGSAGFTLLEVVVALFLIGLGVLAVAPLFVYAMRGNAAGGDLGALGALAVERMELLRSEGYADLVIGGDLSADVTGYSDVSRPGYVVRWRIASNASPANTKIVAVRSVALRRTSRPQQVVTLTTLRGS